MHLYEKEDSVSFKMTMHYNLHFCDFYFPFVLLSTYIILGVIMC